MATRVSLLLYLEINVLTLPTVSRCQPDLAPFGTRYDQSNGVLREKPRIDRALVYQVDFLKRLQKAHDGIRGFQQSELLYASNPD